MTATTDLPSLAHGRRWNALARRLQEVEPFAYAGLRAWFAVTLLTHGLPKILNVPHGEGPPAFNQLVAVIGNRMRLPMAEPLAMLVTLLETAGAIMLALGLGTRIVSAIFAVELLAAAIGVHASAWVWTARGMEYPLLMAALAAYMATRGGGAWSLDRRLPVIQSLPSPPAKRVRDR